jgi:two-component system OmpR family response regulator
VRILIVEDDNVLADSLLRSMREARYAADWLTNGEDADNVLLQEAHDLVILDLGLPRMDGFQVLQRLRQRKSGIPVLILTARGSLEDRIRGLDFGADDYLAKPFDLAELVARVRALLRRAYSKGSNELCIGSLCLDIKGQCVTVAGKALEISAREIGVLETLLRQPGSVVSKEQILEGCCDWNSNVSDNAIEVYIHRLRKKLTKSGIIIRTVRGLGYLLDHANS